MSRRFAAASVFKNALPTPPADKQLWYHELPLTAEDPNVVRASSQWIVCATGSVGGLVAVHWDDTGKAVENKRGGEWNALGGKVWAMDVVEDEHGLTTVIAAGQGGVSPHVSLDSPLDPIALDIILLTSMDAILPVERVVVTLAVVVELVLA